MLHLFEVLEIPKTKIVNQRQYILSQFLDEINKERIGTKYKPLSGRALAIKTSHIKGEENLYDFFSQCKNYKHTHGSFSKAFFGSLKIR